MRYDLHVHTKYSSCSNLDPGIIVKIAKKRGLDGIAITDHNTIKGAVLVKKLCKDDDFEVIIGSEIATTDGGEILAYFLNDEVPRGTIAEVLDSCKAQDSIVSLAHPFDRFRKSFSVSQIPFKKIDALEGWNGRVLFSHCNTVAQETAAKYGVALTAGSDAHFEKEIGGSYTEFESDLRYAIKKRKTSIYGTNNSAFYGYSRTLIRKIGNLYTDNSR